MKMHSGFSNEVEIKSDQETLSRNSLDSKDILLRWIKNFITNYSYEEENVITLTLYFSERLKKKPSENLDLIPSQLLRKYIAYSRQYIPFVSLSQEARKALQDFYLNLRMNHHTMDSTPVTTRQLLSLIRLTQV